MSVFAAAGAVPSSLCPALLRRLAMVAAAVAVLAAGDGGMGVAALSAASAAETRQEIYAAARAASLEILADDRMVGSGFVIDRQGLAFTAMHVVGRPGRRLEAIIESGQRVEASVVAVDAGHEVALLKLAPREQGYAALALAPKPPAVGDDVFLFASPLYRRAVMLRGMVARDDTEFEYYGSERRYVEIVHVAATVQPNTSGGAWLNERGEVVGVQSGTLLVNSVPVGVAHVVSLAAMTNLLRTRQSAATPYLGAGFEETWQQDRGVLDRFPPRTDGLVARILHKDGPADRGGLREGDLVTAVDGRKVDRVAQLLRAVRAKRPGETVELSVTMPDGAGTRQVSVQLGRLEAGWPESDKND